MSRSPAQRVLFLGLDASRTGAPLLLLHFLRWLAANSTIKFEILLRRGGPLLPEYSAIAPTRVLTNDGSSRIQDLFRRVRKKLRLQPSLERLLRRHYPLQSFPLVYANTVAHGELVRFFGQRGHRIICHAHEMKIAIERWGGKEARESAAFIHSFVAASSAVKRDLASAWDLPEQKIQVIHEFGQPLAMTLAAQRECRQRIRAELQIGESEVVVGMCGTVEWRKGTDLFLLLAKAVICRARDKNYRFVWVGAAATSLDQLQLARDLEGLGLQRAVTMVGQVSDPQAYMSAFDVFALTSREDPCPLVMLEAAALGLPIVCFADSGGAPEFVGTQAGIVVPYMVIESMADAVVGLGDNQENRQSLGQAGKAKAKSAYSLESQAPKLLATIERAWP